MLEKNYHTAKNFWRSRDQYPSYDNVETRRLLDINYIVPRIGSASKLLDLGCGDGKISLVLSYLTKISNFTLIDYSAGMIDSRALSSFDFCCGDLSTPGDLPKADAVICLGLFPYIFDDNDLSNLLSSMDVKKVIIRTPCTLKSSDELIDTHSEALDAQYSAVYRTLKNTIALIEPYFTITEVDRIYPDEIESKFGTKQFIFNCEMSS